MDLPPTLHFGSHELKLLPICHSVEFEPGSRCCSDRLLTAFCFVGEPQTGTLNVGGESGDVHRVSNSCGATMTWYYSPLLHFEHKRIRVEEGVIEAALTKAVRARQSADTSSQWVEFGNVESMECGAFCPTWSSEAPSKKPTLASATSLPALYLRLGTSMTFREYALVVEAPHRVGGTVSAEVRVHGDADGVSACDSDASGCGAHKTPVLQPLASRRATLTPIDTQLDGSGLRTLLLSTQRRHAALHRLGSSAGRSAQHDAAKIPEDAKASLMPCNSDAGVSPIIAATPRASSVSKGNSELQEAVLSTPNPVPNVDVGLLLRASNEGGSPPCESPVESSRTSDVCTRRGVRCSKHPDRVAGGSSLSSEFLTSSLFFSCIPSQAPTDVLSTMRFAATDTDGHLASSAGADCSSDRSLDDAHLRSQEVISITPTTCTPFLQSPSCRTDPAAMKPPSVRRPSLRTLHHKSSGIRLSAQFLQASVPQKKQVDPGPVVAAVVPSLP
ncbi:hypothetical protein JKF63_01938 [Porcisia hertigi]|uniref:Uncharacterized protein n=1 Tax=Porcisia hertigi TaxID=2761500 RepID=A0A836I5V3_9TRYP|nr:hypothetical protein JKF63_01938 [Porcisia hertigi]